MHASSEMIRDDASDGEEPETTAWRAASLSTNEIKAAFP